MVLQSSRPAVTALLDARRTAPATECSWAPCVKGGVRQAGRQIRPGRRHATWRTSSPHVEQSHRATFRRAPRGGAVPLDRHRGQEIRTTRRGGPPGHASPRDRRRSAPRGGLLDTRCTIRTSRSRSCDDPQLRPMPGVCNARVDMEGKRYERQGALRRDVMSENISLRRRSRHACGPPLGEAIIRLPECSLVPSTCTPRAFASALGHGARLSCWAITGYFIGSPHHMPVRHRPLPVATSLRALSAG